MHDPIRGYLLQIPGLHEAVASAAWSAGHKHLLSAIRAHEPLASAKLVKESNEGGRLIKRKVLTAGGDLVHEEMDVWLRQELERDHGHAANTFNRLKSQGYLITECELEKLFIVQDNGGDQDNFVQLQVFTENEFVDRRLFSGYVYSLPKDFRDLATMAEEGDPFRDDARKRYRPATYRLIEAVDIAKYLIDIDAAEQLRRERAQQKRLLVTNVGTGETQHVTAAELDPTFGQFPAPGRRLFDDWTRSSAGREARICDHWVIKTNDHTDDNGRRHIGLVPSWTFGQKLAEVKSRNATSYALFAQLEKLDRRVKAPFAWYFFMLHGNRVKEGAGYSAIRAAESGEVVLPEHDYRILKNWEKAPYGF